MNRSRIEVAVLVGLVLAEVLTVYQMLFCVWMMAHPLYASSEWKERLGLLAIIGIALGGGILILAVRCWRRR